MTNLNPGKGQNLIFVLSLVAGVSVLAVMALVLVIGPDPSSQPAPLPSNEGGALGSGEDEPDMDQADGLAACAEPPALVAESVSAGAAGLSIRIRLSSACPNGELQSNNRFRVTAVDSDNRDVAAGIFDLSEHPLVVAKDGSSATFVFPASAYWRVPAIISGDVRLAAYREGVDVPLTGADSPGASVTAIAPAAPESGDLEAAAHSALVDLAASDRNGIDANLLDRWQPQLSSKRPGLVADGITWTMPDIIRENLEFRQMYPDAKLLWSGEWPVFGDPSWWVSMAGIPFKRGEQANAWCMSQGFDKDHCFAKLISHTRGPSGTTALRD